MLCCACCCGTVEFFIAEVCRPEYEAKNYLSRPPRCGTTQQFHSVMSNRLFRRCHLCTVMKGRLFQDFSSRSFLCRSLNPHSSESVSNPRPSKRFRFFVPVDFQSEILPKPAKPAIFPKILLVPTIPSRVGFGDRRPRFERVHQVPTFLISQFFRQSQSFSTRVSCFQGRTTTRTHNCCHSIRAGQLGR